MRNLIWLTLLLCTLSPNAFAARRSFVNKIPNCAPALRGQAVRGLPPLSTLEVGLFPVEARRDYIQNGKPQISLVYRISEGERANVKIRRMVLRPVDLPAAKRELLIEFLREDLRDRSFGARLTERPADEATEPAPDYAKTEFIYATGQRHFLSAKEAELAWDRLDEVLRARLEGCEVQDAPLSRRARASRNP